MLTITGLEVVYGEGSPALSQLDLGADEGSITAVVGGNGAGKSTLLRALSGVLGYHDGGVTAGTARFGDHDVTTARAEAIVGYGMAHVPEGRRVFAGLTVAENLAAGGAAVGGRSAAARLDEIYDLFPVLAERRSQRAVLLSGGEQQMLAIGRGLMSQPRLLLLDEPTLGLAPRIVDQIGEIIRQIRERGTSVLLVEQNAAMALAVADRGFVLEQGRVRLQGTAEELRATDEVHRMYLGGGADDRDDGLAMTGRTALSRWSA